MDNLISNKTCETCKFCQDKHVISKGFLWVKDKEVTVKTCMRVGVEGVNCYIVRCASGSYMSVMDTSKFSALCGPLGKLWEPKAVEII